MKNFHFIFILLLIFVTYGCKNACKTVECGHGICKDGECFCQDGWEKDASGACIKQDLCFGKDCGTHGFCEENTSECHCEEGWIKDAQGKCNIHDVCFGKDCGNGTCDTNTGACICNEGYENGITGNCNTLGTAKFVGTWGGDEQCNFGFSPFYNITITAVPNTINQIRITNFANSDCTAGMPVQVIATVNRDANGSYTKFTNFTTDCSEIIIDQSATNITVNGNTMIVTYKIYAGGNGYACSATMTKQ